MGINKKDCSSPQFSVSTCSRLVSLPASVCLCPILVSALWLCPCPSASTPHKPPYTDLLHGVIPQGHFGMGLPGALLTTPGCSLDGVQGRMTLSTGSKSLYKILEPAKARTMTVSVVSGPGLDCLGVVLSLLAVTQAQPHDARCGEEGHRLRCPLKCPPTPVPPPQQPQTPSCQECF